MRRLAGCLAVVLLAVLGCGVPPQTKPVAIWGNSPALPSTAEPHGEGYFVTVYFVRRGQLFPVIRPAPDPSTATALTLLAAGPHQTEAAMGLETAIAPQPLTAQTSAGNVVTVTAGRDFASISGDNQLLAAAQLVWTVTGSGPSDQVQIAVDGKPIELPTDNGLSREPVRRSDYLSVAPPPGPAVADRNPSAAHS